MADEKNIIDLGSISVPTSWDDITLKKYSEIERYYDDKDKSFNLLDVLDIVIDKDRDFIMSLPTDFLEIILEKLSFITEKPTETEPRNFLEIDGDRYTVHTENQLRTGEYIASDTLIKSDRHNYAALLAILCRKDGELYDSHFENEVLEGRIRLFEEQPITKILPIIGFFLSVYITSMTPTLLSSKIREAIDLTRKDIETSQKNGEISKRSMKSVMRKLRKLEKSINSI